MKYIYDIILNFNESLYEFYEWKDDDNIEYIKKIPIVKVAESVFSDLKNNEFVVDDEFLNTIYNKCEVYGNYGIGKIEYACLFCIDDLLTYLELDRKIKILNYIKEKNITLLNVTSNMEELLYMDKILVMNKGKKEIFDKTEVVLDREDIFKDLGLSLPFIYDINNLLKSYELINDTHIIEKELVDLLWK